MCAKETSSRRFKESRLEAGRRHPTEGGMETNGVIEKFHPGKHVDLGAGEILLEANEFAFGADEEVLSNRVTEENAPRDLHFQRT